MCIVKRAIYLYTLLQYYQPFKILSMGLIGYILIGRGNCRVSFVYVVPYHTITFPEIK